MLGRYSVEGIKEISKDICCLWFLFTGSKNLFTKKIFF